MTERCFTRQEILAALEQGIALGLIIIPNPHFGYVKASEVSELENGPELMLFCEEPYRL